MWKQCHQYQGQSTRAQASSGPCGDFIPILLPRRYRIRVEEIDHEGLRSRKPQLMVVAGSIEPSQNHVNALAMDERSTESLPNPLDRMASALHRDAGRSDDRSGGTML
jgi:hypothetical protein